MNLYNKNSEILKNIITKGYFFKYLKYYGVLFPKLLDLLYLTGHKVKSVLVIKINFEKCQEKKEITLQSLRKKL